MDFNGVNICGACLDESDLTLSRNLSQSLYNGETVWPEDDLCPNDFEPESDISFIDLEETDEITNNQF